MSHKQTDSRLWFKSLFQGENSESTAGKCQAALHNTPVSIIRSNQKERRENRIILFLTHQGNLFHEIIPKKVEKYITSFDFLHKHKQHTRDYTTQHNATSAVVVKGRKLVDTQKKKKVSQVQKADYKACRVSLKYFMQ